MRDLQNSTRSNSNSETSWSNGNFANSFDGISKIDLIKKANSVPIIDIFHHYGLQIDVSNRTIICPFAFHQGASEKIGSFTYYPQTNTFWCFGCKTGITCCSFVVAMDNLSQYNAALKILAIFNGEIIITENHYSDKEEYCEKLNIMLDFSKKIRDFRKSFIFNEKDTIFIENICMAFDALNEKHHLNNEAINYVIQQLSRKIEYYAANYNSW